MPGFFYQSNDRAIAGLAIARRSQAPLRIDLTLPSSVGFTFLRTRGIVIAAGILAVLGTWITNWSVTAPFVIALAARFGTTLFDALEGINRAVMAWDGAPLV